MAKKIKRSLGAASKAQRETEVKAKDKFTEAESIAKPMIPSTRTFAQLSCTIDPEAKDMLDELHIKLTNKFRRRITTSMLIRMLIRLGVAKFDDLHLDMM